MIDYIHNDSDFKDLISIVSNELQINSKLVEKDYWIMHVLYSLQQQGIEFELKGCTSLSKGYFIKNKIILENKNTIIYLKTNKKYLNYNKLNQGIRIYSYLYSLSI